MTHGKDWRSVSQYNEYNRCGWAYYLNRVLKVWKRPAAWLPQGTGVHKATEEWDKSGREMPLAQVEDVYRESYFSEIDRYCDDVAIDYWFGSGPYAAEQDIPRRLTIGLEQVGKYVDYHTRIAPKEIVWNSPDGPAIELAFEIDVGKVPVRGYIDRVIVHPVWGVMVRDVKSGNNPGDAFQLRTYAYAVERLYGRKVKTGDYWMGRKGKPTVPYEMSEWSDEEMVDAYGTLDESVKAELFEPDPEPKKCMFCSVRASCDFAA